MGEAEIVTVYVDDMRARFGRMIMCHMIADTDEELHLMADRIGVARKWYQGDHYDISLLKKSAAISFGAKVITWRQLGCMANNRAAGWPTGTPEDAETIAKLRYEFAKLDRPPIEDLDDDIPF